MADRILIYGATGYMGRILAKLSQGEKDAKGRHKDRLPVVLAGRSKQALSALADDLSLPYRSFGLETPGARAARLERSAAQKSGPNQAIDAALSDVKVLLNAAGPFAETAEVLARACLRTKTHYVDIGGEHEVFRALGALDYLAQQREVSMRPGVGLTPLVSDLLLGMALVAGHAVGLREPHVVRVALSRLPIVSRGSAKTMLDAVRDGVLVRNGNTLQVTPVGRMVRSLPFGAEEAFGQDDPRICTALTLADGLTVGGTASRIWSLLAGRAGAVPNIETYVESSSLERLSYELAGSAALALRSRPIKGYLDMALNMWPEGPSEEDRKRAPQQVFVEVEDRYRCAVRVRLLASNSYDFTAAAALSVAESMLKDPSPALGVVSPARHLLDPGVFLSGSSFKMTFQGLPKAAALDLAGWKKAHGKAYDGVA